MAPTPFGKPVATNDSVFEEVDLISASAIESQIMIIQRKCISDTRYSWYNANFWISMRNIHLVWYNRRSILRMSRIGEVHIVSVGCIQTH